MVKNRMERGQVLVLIILAIVALFGFAALAVDIGRLYAERRRIQSAADAAALSAAFKASQEAGGFTEKRAAALQAALDQFKLNDIPDNDTNENFDIRTDVQVFNPPIDGPYAPSPDFTVEEASQYFQVYVRSEVNAVFSQFVYGGPLKVTVESTARYTTAGGFYDGDVLHALNTGVCNAMQFDGGATAELIGGDAYSDSGRGSGCPGSPAGEPASCASVIQSGSGRVDIVDGSLIASGRLRDVGSGPLTADEGIYTCRDARPRQSIPEIDCSTLTARSYSEPNGSEPPIPNIQPGYYAAGIQVNNGATVLNLEPGVYCLGGDFRLSSGAVTGYGVMLYMDDGAFDTRSGSFNLTAANADTIDPDSDDLINQYTGLLLYMPEHNHNDIHLGGNSTSEYTGTIYAPGPTSNPDSQYKCIIEGDGTSLGVNSNLICDTITLRGNAVLRIDYQEDAGYMMPPSVDQMQ